MKRNFSVILLGILLGLFLIIVTPIVARKVTSLGAGYGPVKTYYDVIGSPTTAVNINTNYASTTGQFLATNLETLALNITYTSVSNTNYLSLLVEVSNDNGDTFFPLITRTDATTSTLAFIEATDGTIGLPILFPADTTVSTTLTYKGSLTFTDIVADIIKVSAKSANSTTSTLSVRAITTSK